MSLENSLKPLEDQLLFKLGTLEASIISGMRRIDEQLDSLAKSIADHRLEGARDISALGTKHSALEDRVTKLETWKTYSKARIAGIVIAVSVFWAIWARPVQEFLNGPLNQ